MFLRKRCNTPQPSTFQGSNQSLFEQTARFCDASNKENKFLTNNSTTRQHRRILIDNSAFKVARPSQKQKVYFHGKSLVTEAIDTYSRQNHRIANSKTSLPSNEALAVSILLGKDFVDEDPKPTLNTQERPDSAAFSMNENNIFNVNTDSQTQQDDSMFNFTFSPTKKPIQRNEDGSNSPQSDQCNDNFNLDGHDEDSKEEVFPYAWYRNRKASLSPNKLSKIKISNILSEKDSSSPPIIRPVQGRPKTYSELKPDHPKKLDSLVDAQYLKYNFSQMGVRNENIQRRTPSREGYQASPLLVAKDKSLIEKPYTLNEASPSAVLREGRYRLPVIMASKRNSSGHSRPLPNPFKIKGVEEKLVNSHIQHDSGRLYIILKR